MTGPALATERTAVIRSLTDQPGRPRRAWAWILTGLFITGSGLMAFAPVSSGIPATGLLQPVTPRQTIQHPTGGVVRTVLVKDGDAVATGAILATFDDAQERAIYSVAKFQALALQAELAVRQAEVKGADKVTFPESLTQLADSEPDVRAIMDAQTAAFDARKRTIANQAAQATQQIEKNNQSAKQAEARAAAAARQLELVREEATGMRTLLEKGLTLKSRVLALDRAEASLNGDVITFGAEVERLKAENVELNRRLEQPDLTARVQASDAMRSVTSELAAAQDRFLAAQAALERTVLRARIAGRVLSPRTISPGSVIRPGEVVMEIVPSDPAFRMNARIKLADADNVRVGQDVTIRFDMVQGTVAPTITGRVSNISADALEDSRSNEAFYEATIAIPPSEAKRVPTNIIAPGRPAEVLIKTGERTLLSYFLLPLQRTQFKAMREE